MVILLCRYYQQMFLNVMHLVLLQLYESGENNCFVLLILKKMLFINMTIYFLAICTLK